MTASESRSSAANPPGEVPAARFHLAATLATSCLPGLYYRAGLEGAARISELVTGVDALFAARAAVFAQRTLGNRAAAQVVAGRLAAAGLDEIWAPAFFASLVQCPGDAVAITSHVPEGARSRLPTVLEEALRRALGSDGAASCGLAGGLRFPGEEPAGQPVRALPERDSSPAAGSGCLCRAVSPPLPGLRPDPHEGGEAWRSTGSRDLLSLVRELPGITVVERGPAAEAPELLLDEDAVRSSLVSPLRYWPAWRIARTSPAAVTLAPALSRAATAALGGWPRLTGSTLVALDNSKSMRGGPAEAGAFLAAALGLMGADLMLFADRAHNVSVGRGDLLRAVAEIEVRTAERSTDFASVFAAAEKAYDRIIVLSDMQGWSPPRPPGVSRDLTQVVADYRERTKSDPVIFSFDLQCFGFLRFPSKNVYTLAGVSDRLVEVIRLLEAGEERLVAEVDAVRFEART